jgi:hypothetical protein
VVHAINKIFESEREVSFIGLISKKFFERPGLVKFDTTLGQNPEEATHFSISEKN